MYIVTNEAENSVANIFPPSVRRYFQGINLDEAEEIRITLEKPMFIRFSDGDYYITQKGVLSQTAENTVTAQRRHIDEILEKITKSSLYSVKDEIKNAYITTEGGHRVGLCGTAVVSDDKVEFIKNISALNIRIATEHKGVSDGVMSDLTADGVKNTLIISPPGCGKTTFLRDIIRNISNMGICVSVADERCEIAAMSRGISPFDLGDHTTVYENCLKSYSMMSLLRSMAPEVIATDELGTAADAEAVMKIINSGVSVIATVHSKNIDMLKKRAEFGQILPFFDKAITLSKQNGPGTVECVTDL